MSIGSSLLDRHHVEAEVLEQFGQGFLVVDGERRTTIANRSARRLLSLPETGFGAPTFGPWRFGGSPSGVDPLEQVLSGGGTFGPGVVSVAVRHGGSVLLSATVVEDSAPGGIRVAKAALASVATDIPETQMTPLFEALFEAAPVAMGLARVDGAGRASIIRMNGSYAHLLGFSQSELVGRGDDLLHPDDQEAVRAARHALATGELDRHATEVRVVRADGSYMWTRMTRAAVPNRLGEVAYVLSIIEDITEHRLRQEELTARAFTDALTGLANRRHLLEFLESALITAPAAVAVVMVDLDGFKAVNDTWGHRRGDEVLVEVAGQLRSAVRPTDFVGRLGGDEFVVVAEVRDADEAVALGRRASASVEVDLGSGDLRCGASVGVAIARPGESPAELVERADRMMYDDKQDRRRIAGRGGHAASGAPGR